ncbi:MAG: hypothetical protein RBT51_13510 [Ectothiorhodospiraceae bacterium]|jgi:hypothetical protein|nr:hypothetical protein [Ectothiorhodospiraceae bacterium]
MTASGDFVFHAVEPAWCCHVWYVPISTLATSSGWQRSDSAVEILRLAFALLLPWLAGAVWLRAVWMRPGWSGEARGNWPMVLGYGFLLGMLGMTLILRVMDRMDLLTAFWLPLLIILAAIAVAIAVGRGRLLQPDICAGMWSVRLPAGWQRWVFALLLSALLVRFVSIGLEVVVRPVYPVDAVTAWSNRARIWFETGSLATPFTGDWWIGSLQGAYLSAGRDYPKTVPLIQIWVAAALGRWDDALVNLPWVLCWASLGLAFYGQARLARVAVLPALLFTYLLLSMPMLNTHAALAGYADLWLTATFGLCSLSFYRWTCTRDGSHAAIVLLLVLGMIAIKQPGFMWLAPLIVAWLAAVVPMRWFIGIFVGVLAALTVIMLSGGFELSLPGIGAFGITPERIMLPLFRDFTVESPAPLLGVQLKHLFVFDNWHLAWPLIVAALITAISLAVRARDLRPMVVLAWSSIALYGFVFFFTSASEYLRIGTLNNRVMLQMMPVLMFLALIVVHRILVQWQDRSARQSVEMRAA